MNFFVETQCIFNADISNVAETGQLSPENMRTKHFLFCFSLKDRLASILLWANVRSPLSARELILDCFKASVLLN